MTTQKLLALCTLCAILCLALGMFAHVAHAQNDSNAAKDFDKVTARKTTVGEALSTEEPTKKGDKSGPTPVQMAIGVGSVIVAIIVVKWL